MRVGFELAKQKPVLYQLIWPQWRGIIWNPVHGEALGRMEKGTELLRTDDQVWEAFRFANNAMLNSAPGQCG